MGEIIRKNKLEAMLAAREARWQKRMALAEKSPSLISATLCVPLPYRTDPEMKALLMRSVAALTEALRQAGMRAGEAEWLDGADGPVCFLPCEAEAGIIKHFCVKQEESLPQGRLLDLDVTARGGIPVGRAELGLPPRQCFLCGRPAAECVSAARHAPEEVAVFVEGLRVRER